MTRRGVTGRAALWAALLLATAACATTDLNSPSAAKARDHAKQALDNFAVAVAKVGNAPLVVPVGDLTGQVGSWEPNLGSDYKIALMAGQVFTEAILGGPAQDGTVTWPDGSTTSVPVMAAQDAIVAISRAATGTCDAECTPMTATDARLVIGDIQTTRGPATGPIWSFTIKGTAVKVTRVAIANALIVPQLPWDPSFSSIGMSMDSAVGSVTGTDVTVSFTGAPEPGNKPCGEDYTAQAVESDLAVVIVVFRGAMGFTLGGCAAIGARRTATATLQKPLGDRAVLNVDNGQPVPMTLLP